MFSVSDYEKNCVHQVYVEGVHGNQFSYTAEDSRTDQSSLQN